MREPLPRVIYAPDDPESREQLCLKVATSRQALTNLERSFFAQMENGQGETKHLFLLLQNIYRSRWKVGLLERMLDQGRVDVDEYRRELRDQRWFDPEFLKYYQEACDSAVNDRHVAIRISQTKRKK